ncbi:MAG: DNA-3-methyladenine glycosylase [Oscillospiraceae bacterium]|nr:DNA-3-methyladenine glycosylase [Oscillospiraceae bacterium]
MRLAREFYLHNAVSLAPLLLGKLLCHKNGREIIKSRITETEAYLGESDSACHAHNGETPRNSVMYNQGGKAYIYLCYGLHNMLNIVSGPEKNPQAVLIRGVENYSGPGKLTKALQITRDLNGTDLTVSKDLWIEDGPLLDYMAAPRIGIGYAKEEDKKKLWRFIAKT